MMVTMLSIAFVPNQAMAVTPVNTISLTSTDIMDAAAANALYVRLYEIKGMDKVELGAPEKKELRDEVRNIKHQLSSIGGGVYISAGALIVILILLIILL